MGLFRRHDPIQRYCDWLTFTAQSDTKYVPKKWREMGGPELTEGDLENLLGDYLNFYLAYTVRSLAPILSDVGREVIGGVVATRCIDWRIQTVTGGQVTPDDPVYPTIYEGYRKGLQSAIANLDPFPEVVPEGSPKEGSLYWTFGFYLAHFYAHTDEEPFAFVAQLVLRTATAHRLHLKQFLRSVEKLPAEAIRGN